MFVTKSGNSPLKVNLYYCATDTTKTDVSGPLQGPWSLFQSCVLMVSVSRDECVTLVKKPLIRDLFENMHAILNPKEYFLVIDTKLK